MTISFCHCQVIRTKVAYSDLPKNDRSDTWSVLVCFLLLWQNTDQKQFNETWICLTSLGSPLKEVKAGVQGRKLDAGTEAEFMEEHIFWLAPFSLLSYHSAVVSG